MLLGSGFPAHSVVPSDNISRKILSVIAFARVLRVVAVNPQCRDAGFAKVLIPDIVATKLKRKKTLSLVNKRVHTQIDH